MQAVADPLGTTSPLRPKSRHGRVAATCPQLQPRHANDGSCQRCIREGWQPQEPSTDGSSGESAGSEDFGGHGVDLGEDFAGDGVSCLGCERRIASLDGGCSSIYAGSTPLDALPLLPLPSEMLPAEHHAELAADLAESQAALAKSRAAATGLGADLRAAKRTAASLRRQLAEAEVRYSFCFFKDLHGTNNQGILCWGSAAAAFLCAGECGGAESRGRLREGPGGCTFIKMVPFQFGFEMQATVEELRAEADSERTRADAAEAQARQQQADGARSTHTHALHLQRHRQVLKSLHLDLVQSAPY